MVYVELVNSDGAQVGSEEKVIPSVCDNLQQLLCVTCAYSCAHTRGGSRGGGVLGVATPPFIYGNAPSSAKQPLPLPRFLYRA